MNKRNRKILISIIIMLMLIAASVSWILYRNFRIRKEAADKVIAETVSSGLTEGASRTMSAVFETGWMTVADHVYSHRGREGSYEHSFRAYDEAIAAGSHTIEQDIVLSSDGVLFVSHELNAAVMTGKDYAYGSMTAAEIDELKTSAGDKVLRLSEVFDRYGRSVDYLIELKLPDSRSVSAFTDIVEEYGYDDIITLQSVTTGVLEKLEERFPDMPKLYICKSQAGFDESLDLPYIDIISVQNDMGLMTKANCESAHEHGKIFSAWTLDSEESICKAIDIGVDTYFTNDTKKALDIERNYGILEGARFKGE